MNKEIPPFYVGQEVECIKDEELVSKGDYYVIESIKRASCNCDCWELEIGVYWQDGWGSSYCADCGFKYLFVPLGHQASFPHYWFRAITPAMEAVTFEQITEQHPVSVN